MSPLPNEPEVLDARLPFPDAQVALDGVPSSRLTDFHTCGWYGTTLHDERGAFAMVNETGPLADLIGDRLRLRYERKSVNVYCFGSTDLPHDIAITRRAFASLELLAVEEIEVLVEVLSG